MTTWPWSTLGLDGPATEAEIRKAYAARLRVTRPDEDAEGFQALVEARDAAMARAAGNVDEQKAAVDWQTDRRKTRKNKEPDLPPTPDGQAFLAAIEHLRHAPDEATRRAHWRDILVAFDALALADVAVARRMIRNEIAREIERPESGAEWTPFYPPSVLRDRSRKAELWVTMINDWIDHVQPTPLTLDDADVEFGRKHSFNDIIVHLLGKDRHSLRRAIEATEDDPLLFEGGRLRLSAIAPAWKTDIADWTPGHDFKTFSVFAALLPLAWMGWTRQYLLQGFVVVLLAGILGIQIVYGQRETDDDVYMIVVPFLMLVSIYGFYVIPNALRLGHRELQRICAQVFKLAAKGPAIQELEQKMVAYVAPDRFAGAFGLIFMIVFVVAELYLLKG